MAGLAARPEDADAPVFIRSASDAGVASVHHLEREPGAGYSVQRGRIALLPSRGVSKNCPITPVLWELLAPLRRIHVKQKAR